MEKNMPKTEEIEGAVEILVAAGVPPATLRDRLDALESVHPSVPIESSLGRRARRALRRGRELKRKPNPTEEAIKILTQAGLDPDAIRGELREAQATAISFGRKPPPVIYPPIDIDKIRVMPKVDFEINAVDQAIATLTVKGINPDQADKLIKDRAEEIQAKAKEIGEKVYVDALHQGEIHLRLSEATVEMKSWLLTEIVGDSQD